MDNKNSQIGGEKKVSTRLREEFKSRVLVVGPLTENSYLE